ncbi:Uncharacterised protein [Mycobacteroides abscessus subsp. bolletii]|uniref:hypothetical protein n=1 Tax=Mycobacteroides abscessus TaxID=36809 RepID=UPI0009D18E45|nr:hypothetical protein [Mycobacteroides abscessus]SLI19075.1 Uncharacterised protein [Mycobacteroides abscessus subsp. bolletii]
MGSAFETIAGFVGGLWAFMTFYVIAIDKPLKKYQPVYEQTHARQLAARDEKSHL